MSRKFVCGAAYRLGETKRHHLEIPGFKSLIGEKRIPYLPEAVGIGSFWATGDIYRLAAACLEATLAEAGPCGAEIDQVIVCSSQFRDSFLLRNRRIGGVLKAHDIDPPTLRGISGTGCVDLLAAIDLATTLLEAGLARNVLVLALEQFQSDGQRVLEHGIVSDAVASLIVTTTPPARERATGAEIRATSLRLIMDEIGAGMRPEAAHQYGEVVRDVLARADVHLDSIGRLFANNVFLPIKDFREREIGFAAAQMFRDNVPRVGHCLSCDPLINFIDCPPGRRGNRFVLYAYAEGHAGAVLLDAS